MLQKVDCESLKTFQKMYVIEFILVKLQTCSYSVDYSFTIHKFQYRFLLKYAPKTSCLNKSILGEKPMVFLYFNKIVVLYCTLPNFTKNGTHVKFSQKALNILMCLQENHLVGRFFAIKLLVQSLCLQFY